MSLPADYISGTITLTNGSPNFTGTGTGWQAADFREGDILLGVEDHAGQVYVIAAITGNAAGTLTQDWAGTSGTYTYRMRYEWDSSRVSAQARAMVELLGNGNLESIAGLTGPGVVVLEGPHSAGIRPFGDFVNGVAYNVQVDTLADRSAYDGQSAGFAVLVSDMGDGRSALFSKASNTSGDWTDAAYVTGPVGPAPEIEATVTSLPPGSTATVTPTPITGGVRLDFELPEAEGFYWFSAYDPDEAYIKDSVVRHNRSAFIATQVVPVGESPSNAFPPVDNTYWDVLAAGGANGEGTVSSVEPGSGIAVDATDPTNPVISLDAAFTDLKDVDFTTNPPEDGDVPVWDEVLEKFIPGANLVAIEQAYADLQTLVENLPFQHSFVSALQTITTAGQLTIAHGLGAVPALVECELVCQVANQGYAVGDVVLVSVSPRAYASANYGHVVTIDATSVMLRYGSTVSVYVLHNKTTGTITEVTNADWRLRVRAWA